MYFCLMSVWKLHRKVDQLWSTLNGCNSKNSQRMTTPLSKMIALFVLNRWYQNEAGRARGAWARPEKVWWVLVDWSRPWKIMRVFRCRLRSRLGGPRVNNSAILIHIWKVDIIQSTKYPKYSGRIQYQAFLFSTGIITNIQEKVIKYSRKI